MSKEEDNSPNRVPGRAADNMDGTGIYEGRDVIFSAYSHGEEIQQDSEVNDYRSDGGQIYSTEGSFQVDDPGEFVEHFFDSVEGVSSKNWAGIHVGTASEKYDWEGMEVEVSPDGTVEYQGDASAVAAFEGVVNSYDGAEDVSFVNPVAADGGQHTMSDFDHEPPVEGYQGEEGPNGAPM